MKYIILMQVDPDVLAALSEEQMQAVGDGHQAFIASITESGEMLSTNALGDPSQSTVVRGRSGVPEVVDGPFAETKEFMGGFYLVDVESKERAIELAKQIPDAGIEGLALEVRPVMYSAGVDM
ncbi:YciI family protein [Leifsonia poae]|uniref:YciI family protein n=1 Tax=Leifsonia poae TaxID=110933 RepID=UPI003D67AF62